jgi:hypothetical protein
MTATTEDLKEQLERVEAELGELRDGSFLDRWSPLSAEEQAERNAEWSGIVETLSDKSPAEAIFCFAGVLQILREHVAAEVGLRGRLPEIMNDFHAIATVVLTEFAPNEFNAALAQLCPPDGSDEDETYNAGVDTIAVLLAKADHEPPQAR